MRLLFVGATGQQCARHDLGARDQTAGRTERRPRQFFGRDDHADRVLAIIRQQAAEALGDRQAEAAEFTNAADDFVRNHEIFAVNRLGARCDDLIGKPPEGIGHHAFLFRQLDRRRLACER